MIPHDSQPIRCRTFILTFIPAATPHLISSATRAKRTENKWLQKIHRTRVLPMTEVETRQGEHDALIFDNFCCRTL
jgi:hypothetical protein